MKPVPKSLQSAAFLHLILLASALVSCGRKEGRTSAGPVGGHGVFPNAGMSFNLGSGSQDAGAATIGFTNAIFARLLSPVNGTFRSDDGLGSGFAHGGLWDINASGITLAGAGIFALQPVGGFAQKDPTASSQEQGQSPLADFQVRVAAAEGVVEMQLAGGSAWEKIEADAPFPVGATLRTGESGTAVVALDANNSILTLTPNAEVRLDSFVPKRNGDVTARVTVLRGEVAGVFTSRRGSSRFEITAPEGETAVYAPERNQSVVVGWRDGRQVDNDYPVAELPRVYAPALGGFETRTF